MAGGKSSTQTNEVELPPELKKGSIAALSGAMQSASLPYSPNRGITQAAFAPGQMDAFRSADDAATAFGMRSSGLGNYLPTPQRDAGGIKGYGSGEQYDQMLDMSTTAATRRKHDDILLGYGNAGRDIDPNFMPSRQGGIAQFFGNQTATGNGKKKGGK
tara:strand:- start:11100 stop:11576 length:477 start_codon:yes stop_codon:yes gene_type:complete